MDKLISLICIVSNYHQRDDNVYQKFDLITLENEVLIGNYSEKFFRRLPENYILPASDKKYWKLDTQSLPAEMSEAEKQTIDQAENERLAQEAEAQRLAKVQSAKHFGNQLINEFIADMQDLELQPEQDALLLQKFQMVKVSLETGMLALAQNALQQIPTDGTFSEELKNKYQSKIQNYRFSV